jgi:Surface-adhesin protein E
MKPISLVLGFILMAVGITVFACTEVLADDWIFYGGSGQEGVEESILRDRYVLNRYRPVLREEARTYHYYDPDSVAADSPYSGSIVRVWERSVLQKETKGYDNAREEVQTEEEARLGRKINVLDYARLFPLAVNRATKETTTLLEINCASRQFIVLEIDNYDKTGKRMTRETTMAMDLWFHIQPETMMEALYRLVCK